MGKMPQLYKNDNYLYNMLHSVHGVYKHILLLNCSLINFYVCIAPYWKRGSNLGWVSLETKKAELLMILISSVPVISEGT